MATPAATSRMTYPEYREHEQKTGVKHEYLRGEVFAMAGGTPEHARLQASMAGELRAALRAARAPCSVFSSDLSVRIEETDRTTYPDVTVICGPVETSASDSLAATNPKLIVEVLSDTTEAADRGEKFAHYRRLASLSEYVLVSQSAPSLEVWRRNERGRWELAQEAGPGEMVRLSSLGVELSVDEIYRDPLAGARGSEAQPPPS